MNQRPSWQLTGSKLVKKFLSFHGTRKFVTVFRNPRHPPLSWALDFTVNIYCTHFTDTIKAEVLQFTVSIVVYVCTLTSLTLLNFVLYNMKGAVVPCECGATRIHPRHSYMKVSPKVKVWLGELIDQIVGHDAFTEKLKQRLHHLTWYAARSRSPTSGWTTEDHLLPNNVKLCPTTDTTLFCKRLVKRGLFPHTFISPEFTPL